MPMGGSAYRLRYRHPEPGNRCVSVKMTMFPEGEMSTAGGMWGVCKRRPFTSVAGPHGKSLASTPLIGRGL